MATCCAHWLWRHPHPTITMHLILATPHPLGSYSGAAETPSGRTSQGGSRGRPPARSDRCAGGRAAVRFSLDEDRTALAGRGRRRGPRRRRERGCRTSRCSRRPAPARSRSRGSHRGWCWRGRRCRCRSRRRRMALHAVDELAAPHRAVVVPVGAGVRTPCCPRSASCCPWRPRRSRRCSHPRSRIVGRRCRAGSPSPSPP